MNFKRYGTSYHPVIRNTTDLEAAMDLDRGLWVATSAPIRAFRMDPEFLKYLDSDSDQRVKCGELAEAVTWLFTMLRNRQGIDKASSTLSPADLNPDHPEAKKIADLLQQISPDKTEVTLQEIRQWRTRLDKRPVSETGVVLPEAARSPESRQFIEDLLKVMPGEEHPSGTQGVNRDCIDDFNRLLTARLDWLAERESQDELGRSNIQPLGTDTAAAFDTYQKVKPAIDHFFQLCDAVNLDAAALPRCWPGLPADLNWEDATAVDQALRRAPLAAPNPERILKFNQELNPAWTRDLHDFRQQVIIPMLDRTDEILSPQIWQELCAKMDAFGDWQSREPAAHLASLPPERLKEMRQDALQQPILDLILDQAAAAVDVLDLRRVEKLALYQGSLLAFANNFIAFPYLYDPVQRAGFEMGTLIMDGRRFNLSVEVPDRAAYLKGIEGGTMFIMILELVHAQRKEKFEIAVPATAGQQGNLKLGKHGVFMHVDGSQWFATVVHIVDNPISLGEAMVAPFKRLGKAVTQKVEAITQSAEKKLEQSGGQVVGQLQAAPAPAAPPASSTPSGNMLAGGGIAIAALGSSAAFITKIFSELQPLDLVKGLMVAVLAVLIPSSIIALLRLSKRDLSILLEGAGWAINSRMRLNAAQCRAFTRKPKFPKDSQLIRDPEWWLWRLLWIVFAIWLISQM